MLNERTKAAKSLSGRAISVTVANVIVGIFEDDVEVRAEPNGEAVVWWSVDGKRWQKRFASRAEANDFANAKWDALRAR